MYPHGTANRWSSPHHHPFSSLRDLDGPMAALIAPNDVAGAPRVGDVLLGKYRVERTLGRGGMGVVVAAQHLQLDALVALKLLLPETGRDGEAVARFVREARAAARINSDHVARVMDVGRLDDGTPYLVMEYLDGIDLAAWLRQHGPLPAAQAVEFLLQTCEAVVEAHAIGIVHRDLKPANLFCIARPNGNFLIKVLDFGISKICDPDGNARRDDLTQSACTMGTPYYMSPEQIRSPRDVDVRSDIWSLGTILFELLAGRVPFSATSLPELYHTILSQPPPQIRAHRPELPEALDAVIQRCLNKTREQRYSSVVELASALAPFASKRARPSFERFLGTASVVSLSQGSAAVPEPAAPPQESGVRSATRQTSAVRPSRVIVRLTAGSVMALLCLGLAIFFVVRRERRPSTESSPVLPNQNPVLPSAAGATADAKKREDSSSDANVVAPTALATSSLTPPRARRAVSSSLKGVSAQPTAAPPHRARETETVPRRSVYDDME